jgi:hypothetical protein
LSATPDGWSISLLLPVTDDTTQFNLKELDIVESHNATTANFNEAISYWRHLSYLETLGANPLALVSRVFAFDRGRSAEAMGARLLGGRASVRCADAVLCLKPAGRV